MSESVVTYGLDGGDSSTRTDPRLGVSEELVPGSALQAVEALDRRGVVVVAGDGPAAALTAAVLLVLVARSHAHVTLGRDAPLPRNPWGASSLAELLEMLGSLRPPARAEVSMTTVVSTGHLPGADRYLVPARWTVATSDDLDHHLEQLSQIPDLDLQGAPFGGMFAAALVAADLFCESLETLGLPLSARRPRFLWNLADHSYRAAPAAVATVAAHWAPAMFAGCGSVGSSAAAALACEDLSNLEVVVVDGDVFDPVRNTFRYPAALSTGAVSKVAWVADMLTAAGASVQSLQGPVRAWTVAQPVPGFRGTVLSSVDDVGGRYEVADVLARTTLSAAVAGLAFHVQREHIGDGFRCPFCDFVSTTSPLGQAAADANLTGLPEQRIVQLLYRDEPLTQADVDAMVAAGKLTVEKSLGLVGARVADARNRIYAQAVVPSQTGAEPPAPLSAPFVSWATGVLLVSELVKGAVGLAQVDRRVEVDLHGYPADWVHRLEADTSGRCACARPARRRWVESMYGTSPR